MIIKTQGRSLEDLIACLEFVNHGLSGAWDTDALTEDTVYGSYLLLYDIAEDLRAINEEILTLEKGPARNKSGDKAPGAGNMWPALICDLEFLSQEIGFLSRSSEYMHRNGQAGEDERTGLSICLYKAQKELERIVEDFHATVARADAGEAPKVEHRRLPLLSELECLTRMLKSLDPEVPDIRNSAFEYHGLASALCGIKSNLDAIITELYNIEAR